MVQVHTASAVALGAYGAGNTFQVQIRVADQIGRSTCAVFVCMLLCIKIQSEILKCELAFIRIDPVLLQRQRIGVAAGNGQGLVIERKTFIQLNVRQQVDLVARYRHADRLVQCRVGRIADLAHILGCGACGAVVVVRRVIVIRFLVIRFLVIRFLVIRFLVIRFLVIRFLVIRFLVIRFLVTRFLVRSFGGEIPCGPVIRCCFIAGKAFLRARLQKVGNRGFLFLQIIKGVGNGGKVTPVQNGAVRIRDGGVGAQCKYTQRQNMKQQSDGKYHYEPSLFHNFFSSSF